MENLKIEIPVFPKFKKIPKCYNCGKEETFEMGIILSDKFYCSQNCVKIHKEKQNKDNMQNALRLIPKRFKEKTLENYKNLPEKVNEYLKKPESLILSGNSGNGKTHIAIGIYKKLAELGKTIHFIPAVEMFYYIRESVKENIDSKIDFYTSFDYLIIDDLGAGKITDWVKEIFYLIIDRLYRYMKNVIITTNMNADEMSKSFDYRIVSRMLEMGMVIKFGSNDYRIG